MVNTTFTLLSPSAYYPAPIIGPILSATLLGSFGSFLPFDKGLEAIKNGVPYTSQAAFFSSCLYYFLCLDKYFFGKLVRSIFYLFHLLDSPDKLVSKENGQLIIACLQILHLCSHVLITTEFNLAYPFQKIFFLITRLQGKRVKSPTSHEAFKFFYEKYFQFLRIVLFICFMFYHVLSTTSHPYLYPISSSSSISLDNIEYSSDVLLLDTSISSCTYLSDYRSCIPSSLTFELISCNDSSFLDDATIRDSISYTQTSKNSLPISLVCSQNDHDFYGLIWRNDKKKQILPLTPSFSMTSLEQTPYLYFNTNGNLNLVTPTELRVVGELYYEENKLEDSSDIKSVRLKSIPFGFKEEFDNKYKINENDFKSFTISSSNLYILNRNKLLNTSFISTIVILFLSMIYYYYF